jgi:hypothetical protein
LATSDVCHNTLHTLFDSKNSDESDEDDMEKMDPPGATASARSGSPDWDITFSDDKERADGFEEEEEEEKNVENEVNLIFTLDPVC